MGVKSTHEIKRELAIKLIKERIDKATDEQLERALEELFDDESTFRNYSIVKEFSPNWHLRIEQESDFYNTDSDFIMK